MTPGIDQASTFATTPDVLDRAVLVSTVDGVEELRVLVPPPLDAAGRRQLAGLIETVLSPGGRRMIIELGSGRGVDAALLRQLRKLRATVAALGCELTVSASAAGPRRLLQLTGLAGGAVSTAPAA